VKIYHCNLNYRNCLINDTGWRMLYYCGSITTNYLSGINQIDILIVMLVMIDCNRKDTARKVMSFRGY